MKRQKWNEGWKFWADKDSFALVWNVPENAREINLPHDAMIEEKADPESPNKGNTGFRNGGVYTYVKNLYVPEEAKGKTMMLEFVHECPGLCQRAACGKEYVRLHHIFCEAG